MCGAGRTRVGHAIPQRRRTHPPDWPGWTSLASPWASMVASSRTQISPEADGWLRIFPRARWWADGRPRVRRCATTAERGPPGRWRARGRDKRQNPRQHHSATPVAVLNLAVGSGPLSCLGLVATACQGKRTRNMSKARSHTVFLVHDDWRTDSIRIASSHLSGRVLLFRVRRRGVASSLGRGASGGS